MSGCTAERLVAAPVARHRVHAVEQVGAHHAVSSMTGESGTHQVALVAAEAVTGEEADVARHHGSKGS